jgi:hypothetical protein
VRVPGGRVGRVMRLRRLALVGLVVVVLGSGLPGCSLGGTGPTRTTRSSASATATVNAARSAGDGSSAAGIVARADRTHEVPTPAGRQSVTGGWRSPTQAVYVFATQYINWNWQDVSARLRALESVSVGQARSAVSAAASETASDDELKQGQVANSGVVEAIAPVIGHRYEYAVATRERTTASGTNAYQGIAPEWHLALATVTRLEGGLWVLSDWQPEN